MFRRITEYFFQVGARVECPLSLDFHHAEFDIIRRDAAWLDFMQRWFLGVALAPTHGWGNYPKRGNQVNLPKR
jgi:hypothetical protein